MYRLSTVLSAACCGMSWYNSASARSIVSCQMHAAASLRALPVNIILPGAVNPSKMARIWDYTIGGSCSTAYRTDNAQILGDITSSETFETMK